MIRKLPSGRWQVDFQPGGRGGKRVRKSFDTKTEAQRYERWAQLRIHEGKEWNPEKERRLLSDLVDEWYKVHGHSLKYGQGIKKKLHALVARVGDPKASAFSSADFAAYRSLRLEGDGVSEHTVNREHAYLKAMFNELTRVGAWSLGNPLENVRKLKTDESELAFLDDEEIKRLLVECQASSNPSLYHVTRLALVTGARWSEAEGVTRSQFSAQRVSYKKTKSGKVRSVPIAKDLYGELVKALPFESCMAAFRSAVKRAGIKLPRGQLTHVCRHTFASHFMMNGGDILTLQKILGHSDIKLTMRYAHLSPSHVEQAVRFAPRV